MNLCVKASRQLNGIIASFLLGIVFGGSTWGLPAWRGCH